MIRRLFLILAVLVCGMGVMAQDDEGGDNGTVGDVIYGLVVTNAADVRAGPDFAYPKIAELPHNASVVVLGRSGDFFNRWDGRQWLQVEFEGRNAWIYARLLRTSQAFNSIPPTGRLLPRDRNGRVPEGFDLSTDICSQWRGGFTQSSGTISPDSPMITVTYPGLQGANVWSVIVISPTGVRRAFDSTTTTAVITYDALPRESGTYTWRVAPYWTDAPQRSLWQQVCLLRTGGTFNKPSVDD